MTQASCIFSIALSRIQYCTNNKSRAEKGTINVLGFTFSGGCSCKLKEKGFDDQIVMFSSSLLSQTIHELFILNKRNKFLLFSRCTKTRINPILFSSVTQKQTNFY